MLYNTRVELKTLLAFIKKNALITTLIVLIFGLVGVGVYYLLPIKYLASGSLYVKRSVENGDSRYFTYEGYYNQQTAISYTNTVMGFLESIDVRSKALNNLGLPVSEQSLRQLGKQIKVKKSGNQLITLSVKDSSPQQAQNLWNELAKNTINTAQQLNKDSDPALQISQLQEGPVVKEVFRNVWVNFVVGAAFGLVLAFLSFAFISYMQEQK